MCGKRVGQGIKRTHIHHIEYHDEDPFKSTVELCVSCHDKEGRRLGQIRKLPRDKLGRFISRTSC